ITVISRFQLWTQPLWIVLQVLPFVFILWQEWSVALEWVNYQGEMSQVQGVEGADGHFDLMYFGAASAVVFALIAQIGEQVDFLRFLPEPQPKNRLRWWLALIGGGPG
ncbi:hypothetical protein Q4595_23545, partial [Wenyingzhuangia sp. 1_MG-2023]|nr:hypothetical protein [Wenyingzhuangia sp. 1_MG-2023]